jgi:PhnB protein
MKSSTIEPYLFFGGRCEEALAFYQEVLGAKLEMLMRHEDSPEPAPPGMLPEGFGKKIMHASILIGDSRVMASDGCGEPTGFDGFSLSLSQPTEADAARVFAALAEGGEVRMPLGKTFWSPCFGMVQDPFGIGWMVSVPGEPPQD